MNASIEIEEPTARALFTLLDLGRAALDGHLDAQEQAELARLEAQLSERFPVAARPLEAYCQGPRDYGAS